MSGKLKLFQNVVLRKNVKEGTDEDIIMGIELKGWYLLAKEAEPSFRFQATPEACAVQDLIVVVPWVLNNVMSGSPKVMRPYIESSRYAAEYRNYHWEHLREIKGDKAQAKVTLATGVSPYPKKSDQISDKPVSDSGGNFGRYARTGLMDTYKASIMQEDICGIEATHWLNFFKLFQDNQDSAKIAERITALRTKITASKTEQKSIAIKILDVIEDNT